MKTINDLLIGAIGAVLVFLLLIVGCVPAPAATIHREEYAALPLSERQFYQLVNIGRPDQGPSPADPAPTNFKIDRVSGGAKLSWDQEEGYEVWVLRSYDVPGHTVEPIQTGPPILAPIKTKALIIPTSTNRLVIAKGRLYKLPAVPPPPALPIVVKTLPRPTNARGQGASDLLRKPRKKVPEFGQPGFVATWPKVN